ncbi:MAG: type II/IV secretion system protein, partial [Candidatus Hydrogenedentes bacterium]|nr:type II/IV secretion system protein [Candidatus Hydrogenedentota bacterium]
QTTMSNRRLGEVLVRLGYITRRHISQGLAEQLDIPTVNLVEIEIPKKIVDIVPLNVALIYRIVPVRKEGDVLWVAMADPTDIDLLDNLERLLEVLVRPLLCTPTDIREGLSKYYGASESTVESMLSTMTSASTMSTMSSLSSLSSVSSASASDSTLSGFSSLSSVSDASLDYHGGGLTGDEADEGPVIQYVHNLILEAFRERASDIHIEPQKGELKVRYRIDGVMHYVPSPPKKAQGPIISRVKIMAGMDISERRLPQDGRIKLNLLGKNVDLRVSALPGIYGESLVMRILDKSGLMLGLGELGFIPDDEATWDTTVTGGTGIVLVTGPTGSGKTTTLYATLHKLNTAERNIITVEDPVEYQLRGINQVQVHADIGRTFAHVLRSMFRQDPDILMVGEIRDLETAEIATRAALTGQLVFSTVHTNDAPSAIIRLVDIGVKPYMVAATIRAILAQRLVRCICSTCSEVYEPSDEEQRIVESVLPGTDARELYRGAGCENCNNTGYQGRVGVFELLLTNEELKEMMLRNASSTQLRQRGRELGMKTLREDGVLKVINGVTTLSELLRVTQADEALPASVMVEAL